MLFDSHCHLTDPRYREDLPEVLTRACVAGVGGVVVVASDLVDAERVMDLCDAVEREGWVAPRLWGTAGVHPHEAASAPPDLTARLREALARPGVVAVGECGLDFHYDHAPRSVQRRVFDLHLEAAAETGMPVVVHCREAEEVMAGCIRAAGAAGVRGVLHCFPGDPELLAVALDAGWLVSFTGLVTFRSFAGGEAVRTVPADRYMLETDGPWLAPVPHRGKRNEPAHVALVRDRIAELRGETAAEVVRDTGRTARAFFRLPPEP